MIRTGSIGLDIALGGGWKPGTMNEVWGDTGAGKTVLALHTVESVTRAGGEAVWIDLNDGVRHMTATPSVMAASPRNAEEAFYVATEACRYPEIRLVVVDPAQMLVRQRELDGDPSYVPHPQREYRAELNELKVAATVSDTVVLFVGQPRDKERQPVRGTGISEKVRYRVHLHPDVVHQNGVREIAASVKDVPGKTSRHGVAYYNVRPGFGIDRELELVETGIEVGALVRQGSWVYYGAVRQQGVRAAAQWLRDDPGLFRLLENDIRVIAGIA